MISMIRASRQNGSASPVAVSAGVLSYFLSLSLSLSLSLLLVAHGDREVTRDSSYGLGT